MGVEYICPLRISLILNQNPSLQLEARASVAAVRFGARIETILLQNKARNNTSGPEFKLDDDFDYDLFISLGGFGGSSAGVQLSGLDDSGSDPEGSDDLILNLDPTQFNLSAFNVSLFYEYLDTILFSDLTSPNS
jgi:hypothetical protein